MSSGLLCEDTTADSSSLDCGYQVGAKLAIAASGRSRLVAEMRHEDVNGYLMNLLSAEYMARFGPGDLLGLGLGVQHAASPAATADNRVQIRLTVGG